MLDGGAVSWSMWMQFNRVEFEAPVTGSVTDQAKDYIPGLGGQSNEMDYGAEGNNVPIRCLVRPCPFQHRAQEHFCDGGQRPCALPERWCMPVCIVLMGLPTVVLQAGYRQGGHSSNYDHQCYWDPPATCSGSNTCTLINYV